MGMESGTDQRSWAPKPWSWLLWAAIAGVFVWQINLAINNSKRDEKTKADHVSDFTAFYAAGKLALAGENIYDFKKSGISRRPYLYPPTFAAMVMMPLALLPYNAAVVVFSLLNGALLLGALWLLRKILDQSRDRQGASTGGSAWKRFLLHPNTAILFALAISFRFIAQNWRHGNVNMFLAFLLVLALWLMLKRSARGEFSSGLSIALATAFKVTPGLFGLYLFWSRRVYGMAGGALGLVVFLLLIPALALGWSYNWERLDEYKNHMTSAVRGEDEEAATIGHARADLKEMEGGLSIRGSLMRYFTYKPMKYTNKQGVVTYYGVNFVTLPEETARWISYGFEMLLLVLTIFLTARVWAWTSADGIVLSFGLVTLCMLLIAPLTRTASLCVLLLPCAALIALVQRGAIVGKARSFTIAALALMLLSGVIFSEGIVGPLYGEWFSHAGAKGLWVLLLLYAANALAIWKCESAFRGAKDVNPL